MQRKPYARRSALSARRRRRAGGTSPGIAVRVKVKGPSKRYVLVAPGRGDGGSGLGGLGRRPGRLSRSPRHRLVTDPPGDEEAVKRTLLLSWPTILCRFGGGDPARLARPKVDPFQLAHAVRDGDRQRDLASSRAPGLRREAEG